MAGDLPSHAKPRELRDAPEPDSGVIDYRLEIRPPDRDLGDQRKVCQHFKRAVGVGQRPFERIANRAFDLAVVVAQSRLATYTMQPVIAPELRRPVAPPSSVPHPLPGHNRDTGAAVMP
jgi:hypothetical protein